MTMIVMMILVPGPPTPSPEGISEGDVDSDDGGSAMMPTVSVVSSGILLDISPADRTK